MFHIVPKAVGHSIALLLMSRLIYIQTIVFVVQYGKGQLGGSIRVPGLEAERSEFKSGLLRC